MLNNIYQQKIIPWLKDNFLFVNVQLMRKTQIGLSHTLSITENKLLFTSWLDVLNQDSLHLYFPETTKLHKPNQHMNILVHESGYG